MRFVLLVSVSVLSVQAAFADDLRDSVNGFFEPVPTSPPALVDNEVTPERVALGDKLFHDANLSASGFFACSTCHNLSIGGDDDTDRAIGHDWQDGSRNTPTILNSVFNEMLFWDGTEELMAARAEQTIRAGVGQSAASDRMVATLKTMPAYEDLFRAAFPGESDPISFDTMTKALEAYQATLITPGAPFDAWLNGDDDALTPVQREGLEIFVDTGCAACHDGVNLGGNAYYPFGVAEKPADEITGNDEDDRFTVTQSSPDGQVFRASPLRNITLTAPYFHSGKVRDLKFAVMIMGQSQLGAELSEEDVDKIVEFLHALEGDTSGLR